MQIGGYISYSKALLFGILVVVFAGILSSVCTALLHMFDPSYTQNMIDASIRLIERMNIPEVQIEAARAKVVAQMESTYSNPFLAILNGLQGSLIFGLILCLITSIFTRKAKPMDFQ